ncbi:MAG: nucleoside kinase [Verrucomicrobiota bacterium]
MNSITVRLKPEGKAITCDAGTTVNCLMESSASPFGIPYIAARVNNDLVSLSYPLSVNCEVAFLTMADPHGWRIYRRSLAFMLAKAVRETFPDARFSVDHSFGLGLYCSFSGNNHAETGITSEELQKINENMNNMVQANLQIERRKISFADAVRQFEEADQTDKLNLLKYRNPPRVVVHWCDGFSDLAHGPLAPETGALRRFELVHYPPGFVLHLPDRSDPLTVPPFEDQPHLFQIFQEHKEWGRILEVNTVGKLNEIIANNKVDNFVMTAEALHEKKIARIADQIATDRDKIKLVLVAGPSSSGKTTFSKKLVTHLTVTGMKPTVISTDDYFVSPDRNPRDENGEPDYEHIEAVDVELFNRHLLDIIEGREVELPKFDFTAKTRKPSGSTIGLEKEQVLIVEGIHGLNPELTRMIPSGRKFKIYVSALTQLAVDANNRISTTDNRLMRRLVRDSQFRGYSALETLRRWPSVRRGEKKWIFPYQKEADATFNSALDYELAVLKPHVESLLMQVKPMYPEYAEARRLTEFLLNFLALSESVVPPNSLLREYIGGSRFKY